MCVNVVICSQTSSLFYRKRDSSVPDRRSRWMPATPWTQFVGTARRTSSGSSANFRLRSPIGTAYRSRTVSETYLQATRVRHELRPPDAASSDSVWPLSFPCVVTRLKGDPPLVRCRTWIQGRNLRELGVAAAQELDATADGCEFTLVEPDNASGRMFLEVLRQDAEALVGPMAGPKTPLGLSRSPRYVLEDLIRLLCLSDDVTGSAVYTVGRYVLTVRYASTSDEVVYPPPRLQNESEESYRGRCAAAEILLIERASYQGFFALQYSVPPCDWTARDLASVIDLVYRHLPASEPASREPGWLSWRPNAPVPGCCTVSVTRGDYTASLRVPSFPRLALAEWLSDDQCTIALYQPLATEVLAASASSAAPICSPMPCYQDRGME
jgi:hypothetical protein